MIADFTHFSTSSWYWLTLNDTDMVHKSGIVSVSDAIPL